MRRAPAVPTRTRCSSRRTSSSAARARPACSSCAASCSATGCPTCPAAARSPTSTRSSTATSTTRRTARRAARRRSSSRSAPGWCSSSRRRSAPTTIRAREERCCAGRVDAWRRNPNIEILGNLDAERLSIVSFVVAPAAAAGTCTTTSSSRCSTTCSASSRAAAARAPGPYGHRLLGIDIERSHEFEREIVARLRGHQAGLGAGQLQLLHLRGGVPTTSSTPSTWWPTHGWRLLPEYRFDPATGLWRHRGGPVEPPLRLASALRRRRRGCAAPSATTSRPRSALAGYLDEARAAAGGPPGGRPRPRRRPRPPGCRPTSRSCAGSSSRAVPARLAPG